MEQHEVYLVLTRSHTLLSRLIHQVTQKALYSCRHLPGWSSDGILYIWKTLYLFRLAGRSDRRITAQRGFPTAVSKPLCYLSSADRS